MKSLRRRLNRGLALQNRIERELKRARLSGNIQAGSNFNPHPELMALTGLLHKIYADKKLTFEFKAPDQLFPYDREDMLELLGNLVDNACKWAANIIAIEVAGSSDTLTIKVADDGPGITDEQKKDLTQRGLRLDESQPGHGLGLAIVDDIVAFYGGELILKKSLDLGGLEITVNFKF